MSRFLGSTPSDSVLQSNDSEEIESTAPPQVPPGRRSTRNSILGSSDYDAWRKINLLGLDGGGVRGYWSLLMLQKLMYFVGETEVSYKQKDQRSHENRDEIDGEYECSITRSGGHAGEDSLDGKNSHSFWPQALPENVSQIPKGAELSERDDETKEDYSRKYLPCHYFDYIGGSSTGALIAIMLGRFRMTVDDCLAEYETMSHQIFGKPRWLSQRNTGFFKPKYSSSEARRIFQEVTERRSEKREPYSGPINLPTEPGLCKVFVMTLKEENNNYVPHILRSYRLQRRLGTAGEQPGRRRHAPRSTGFSLKYKTDGQRQEFPTQISNLGEADNIEVSQVASAATAAIFYFKAVRLSRHPKYTTNSEVFTDGGLVVNNPTLRGLWDIQHLHGKQSIGTVVSVGTCRNSGEKTTPSLVEKISMVHKHFRRGISREGDPEPDHQKASEASEERMFQYYRFNNLKEPLAVELDDCNPRSGSEAGKRTFDEIKRNFDTWLGQDNNKERLRECAQQLVDQRRRRIRSDSSRWERFSTGVQFYCHVANCEKQFFNKEDFLNHLNDNEEIDISKLASAQDEQLAKDGLIKCWRYQDAGKG